MSRMTRWGRALDPENVLPEYPRPQFVRDNFQILNGTWDFAITDGESPTTFSTIVVPFSPEAPLSGVNATLEPHQTAWYRRTVTLDYDVAQLVDAGRSIVVNFGAVDQIAHVAINGAERAHHVGGYLPFSVQVHADDLREGTAGREFDIEVRVRDYTDTSHHSRGKQKSKRGGIWYTPQSGIWQTVWLEALPAAHVSSVEYACDINAGTLTVTPHVAVAGTDGAADGATDGALVSVRVSLGGALVADGTVPAGKPLTLTIPDPQLWSPESPTLYDVELELPGSETVRSYTALRSFGMAPDAHGVPRLLLNGKPYFHMGVLDQGYWPDGLYTAPSDEAFVWDLEQMKAAGFNMVRKHIKVEPMRFYHHCDRLGLIVWQDMINGGGDSYRFDVITLPVFARYSRRDDTERAYRAFARKDAEGRAQFERELIEMISHLKQVPSIGVWVPFNEGWGQFDSVRITELVRKLDPTRLIDHASGWHDQQVSDMRSLHIYFKAFRMPRNDGTGRALVVSEYGGYLYEVPGTRPEEKKFGYRTLKSAEALLADFTSLHRDQMVPAVSKGLSALVYSQVSDVEGELNGLVSYDRDHVKMPAQSVAVVLREVLDEFTKSTRSARGD